MIRLLHHRIALFHGSDRTAVYELDGILKVGGERAPSWLHHDFILGYFGDKVSAAQLGYKKFVSLSCICAANTAVKNLEQSVRNLE